jgi:HEAT repeat protein
MIRVSLIGGALALSVGAAAALRAAYHQEVLISGAEHDSLRPGPDSARVVRLLDALGKTDPLVCEMLADQVGNFWTNEGSTGIGRFADAARALYNAKDSLAGHASDPAAIRVMVANLGVPNSCVRRVASKLLGRSRVTTDRLVELMRDRSPLVREAAAYAAGTGDRKEARGSLTRLLDAGTGAEAAIAAWALGEIEDTASIPALGRASRSADVRVRAASVWALGSIGDERALADVDRALRSDANSDVRREAAHALGEIGSVRSASTLAGALDDASVVVRYAAAEALSDLNDLERAPEQLVRAARSPDPRLRKAAARALAEIHDPATVDVLIGLLSSDDRDTRLAIVEALGEIKSAKAQPGLLRALKDPDPEIRRAAAEALGEMREGKGTS